MDVKTINSIKESRNTCYKGCVYYLSHKTGTSEDADERQRPLKFWGPFVISRTGLDLNHGKQGACTNGWALWRSSGYPLAFNNHEENNKAISPSSLPIYARISIVVVITIDYLKWFCWSTYGKMDRGFRRSHADIIKHLPNNLKSIINGPLWDI